MCNNLANYDLEHKYLLSNVNIHTTINQIESNAFLSCGINKRNKYKCIVRFMKRRREMDIIYMKLVHIFISDPCNCSKIH